jgi:D-sedoheptulose 7-phosphate isomerase
MGIEKAFDEHLAVVDLSRRAMLPVLDRVLQIARTSLAAGGKLMICGNGGSAADAQHFAAECVGRYEHERGPIAAVALTTDTSTLTAVANDFGYEHAFSRQIAALARPGDVLFAISTSGNSPSVLRAAEQARSLQCHVVAFTGQGGGKLGPLADTLVAVPSTRVSRIQEVHELCLHALAEALEAAVR